MIARVSIEDALIGIAVVLFVILVRVTFRLWREVGLDPLKRK